MVYLSISVQNTDRDIEFRAVLCYLIVTGCIYKRNYSYGYYLDDYSLDELLFDYSS